MLLASAGLRVSEGGLEPPLQESRANLTTALLKNGQPRSVPANAFLCREGETTDKCFFLTQGQVRLERHYAGRVRKLMRLDPGAMIAVMAALDGKPMAISARTVLDSTVVEIRRPGLCQMLGSGMPNDLDAAHLLAVHGIRQLRGATTQLAHALCESLRGGEHPGAIDPQLTSRVHISANAWPLVVP
jgi:CRP-like cAMP-binding protein